LLVPEGTFAPYELVRELGARPVPAYAVRQVSAPGAKTHLFVAERFVGAALGPDGKDSDFVREARRIATLTSPNLPRVRDVVVRGEDLLVYTELVDGEKLAALWRPEGLPLEIALRVIVDVLSGVATLHNLRDARQQPLKLAHGEISPATIVFGLDGVARILHAVARRSPGVLPDPASVRTMAPEVLTGEPYDQRADVFGAGALLWEALCGKPLFTATDPLAVAAWVRAGEVPRATVPASAPWAKDLVEVAARALSASPDERWANATVMAGELRKAAGLRLAPVSTTAAFAKSAIAERVKARRQALETQVAAQRAPAPASRVPPPPVVVPPRAEAPAFSPPPAPVAYEPPPASEATPDKDVLVAPGIRAPVAEVFELGSESLLEASDSAPPPAPPAGAGLDPFSLSSARPSPPPPPVPPVVVAPAVPASSAPEPEPPPPPAPIPARAAFDMAFAPPVTATGPLPAHELPEQRRPLMETAPSIVRVSEREEAMRRRKVLVLGGVAALGGLILVLALVRWVTRDTGSHASPSAPVVAHVAPPVASPAVAPPAPSPVANIPPLPPPATVAAPSAPPPVAPAPPTAVAAAPAALAAAPQTAAATRPKPPPAPRPAAAAPRPKKRKPVFDPNTL
jgi:serine/threonine-protein kinase